MVKTNVIFTSAESKLLPKINKNTEEKIHITRECCVLFRRSRRRG